MIDHPLIWFKGTHVPSTKALVSILSPTAQFGLNVFEGLRGYGGQSGQVFLFRIDDHLRRLMQSCALLGIASPYDSDYIKQAVLSIIRANNMHCDLAVRVTLFVEGEGSWLSHEPVDMFIAPIPRPRNLLTDTSGKTASISSWRRIDDTILPPRTKAGANYINGRYAHLEAQANGTNLPILLNLSGKVAEGAGACIFMVRDGILVTPIITASILESITRTTLIRLASEIGLIVKEREIDRTELYLAEEVFLCGSAAELSPITRIDRFPIGNGLPGPITRLLSRSYFNAADGTSNSYRSWLTPAWTD
jgi:branched-chain amino acid aminotransferase